MLTMPKNAPPAYHVLVKPTGAVCNLDCKYCFFLSKEMLYPDGNFRMADDLLEIYIRQLLESHTADEVMVSWQGGEPTLMGLDFFKRSVELVAKYRKPNQQILYSLQTNGTKLTDDFCAFFKQNNFLLGLSVDGPREIHNTYRLNKGGQGTFDQVMAGWESLKKHAVDVNILCTVNAANADHPLEVYHFFRDDLGARYIQFIPIVERVTETMLPLANQGWSERPGGERPLYMQAGSLVTDRSVGSAQYGSFLSAIFDEWVRRDVGEVFIPMFDATLASWLGMRNAMCVFNETCGQALALEHNGDLYSCDHFVEPGYLLGNIKQEHMIELVSSPKQIAFGEAKRNTLPRYCRECEVRFACHGECPRNRFITTPDGEPGLNYLCASYKAFFKHVDKPMRMMAKLLQQGRYADEVMGLLAAEETALQAAFAKAKGHDPCPCGSGQKFRNCHGRRKDAPAT